MFVIREPGESNSTSASLSSPAPSSSQSHSGVTVYQPSSTFSYPPYFAEPTGSPSSNDSEVPKNDLAKTVLEWVFLALAIVLIGGSILRRVSRLRRNGQPMSHLFCLRRSGARSQPLPPLSVPRTTGLPSLHDSSLTAYPPLANVPVSYQPRSRRQTRAADIGEGGRRLGEGESDYHHEDGEKDDLPPYDKFGGPPGYVEVQMQTPAARFMGMMGIVQPAHEGRTTTPSPLPLPSSDHNQRPATPPQPSPSPLPVPSSESTNPDQPNTEEAIAPTSSPR